MIGTSVVDYIHIQFWIILLSSVVPLSVSYLGYDSIRRVLAALTWIKLPLVPLPWSLRIYALAEVIFHFVVYVPLQRYLQRAAIHPPSTSQEEREKLFALCNDSVADPEQYLSKWFMGAPITTIKREDLKGFFKWAFFNSDDVEMPENETELEGYCQRMEASLGRSIPPGRSGVRCLRTTLDTVPMSHRSLLWYGAVFFVDNLTFLLLTRFIRNRYHHHRLQANAFVFPPRPLSLLLSKAPSPSYIPPLSYFHRPHTSTTRLPILFLHGIGIGLYPYVPFLSALTAPHPADAGLPGIIALEILPVSFRIASPVPSKEEMCLAIHTILQHHGYSHVVLVTHSYGSIIATHALLSPLLAPSIASLVLVDPVSILLHLPDVAYNFTRRKPQTANHHQLSYFASLDPCVAHTLARRFFWADNILWLHHLSDADLLPNKVSVWISADDLIVNASHVRKYLQDGGVTVHWCKGKDHGQIFDDKSCLTGLVEDVRRASLIESTRTNDTLRANTIGLKQPSIDNTAEGDLTEKSSLIARERRSRPSAETSS